MSQQQQDVLLLIKQSDAQKILDYIGRRPAAETYHLIPILAHMPLGQPVPMVEPPTGDDGGTEGGTEGSSQS